MDLEEFIEKWNGKFCEVAGSSWAYNQCVDLANAYIRDVLGESIIEWTNARDFPSKVNDNYEYILNTPEGVPEPGDIVIWDSADHSGHIAIFIEGTNKSFRSFDQNYPTGSPCHVQGHYYNNVLGWLRHKGGDNMECNECEFDWVDPDGGETKQKTGLWLSDELTGEKEKRMAVEKKLAEQEGSLQTIGGAYGQCQMQLTEAQENASELTSELATLKNRNLFLLDEIAELKDHPAVFNQASTGALVKELLSRFVNIWRG